MNELMYACRYECMFVCLHGCMVVCLYVCMFVCLFVCVFVCLYVCMFACLHVWMFACLHVCRLHVCMFVCLHALYVCMFHTFWHSYWHCRTEETELISDTLLTGVLIWANIIQTLNRHNLQILVLSWSVCPGKPLQYNLMFVGKTKNLL
jgi:hypothetical protein